MDLVLHEKEAILNPSKSSFFNRPVVEETNMVPAAAPPPSNHRQVSEASTPGAFHVGRLPRRNSGSSVSVDTLSSDSSESCVVIIPRASLVEENPKDLEAAKVEPSRGSLP